MNIWTDLVRTRGKCSLIVWRACLAHSHAWRWGQVRTTSSGSLCVSWWTGDIYQGALGPRSIPTSGSSCHGSSSSCCTTSTLNPTSFGCKTQHKNQSPLSSQISRFIYFFFILEPQYQEKSLSLFASNLFSIKSSIFSRKKKQKTT